MELRILRYFVTVAKQLSFSRAAESLYVSQSSLSKQISALEDELGMQLFIRANRSIELTPAGQVLLNGAEKLLRDEDSLLKQVQESAEYLPTRHRLTISLEEPVTANDSVCKELISLSLDFKRYYHPLEMEFHYENKPLVGSMENVDYADIYFCVSNQNIWNKEYECRVISKDRFVLAASDKLIQSVDGDYRVLLEHHPLLMLENEGRGIMDITKVLFEMNCRPEIRFSKSDLTIALDLATEAGVSIVPEKKARHLEGVGVSTIAIPDIDAEIYLYAVFEKRNQNPLIDPFINELIAHL